MLGTNMAVDMMSKEKGGRGGIIINVASTAGDLFIFVSLYAV